MKLLLLSCFILFSSSANILNIQYYPAIGFKPSANAVFLCCRGTLQKQGLVAAQFNFIDSNITHVGIGFTTKDGFRIFHVSDSKKSGNYFCIETVEEFLSEKGVFYFSAWELEATGPILSEIKRNCLDEKNSRIVFDTRFSNTNGDTLYCSEFCRNILLSSGFDCLLQKKKMRLSGDFYRMYFGADAIEYVPVDFFYPCNLVKKYYDTTFSNR